MRKLKQFALPTILWLTASGISLARAATLDMPHPNPPAVALPEEIAAPDPPQTLVFCAQSLPCATTANNTHSGLEQFSNLEGLRFADQFANINAAVTAAGTTGAVVIPPNYTGTDTPQANSVPMIDFRQNTNAGIGFYHGVRSLFPSQSSPSLIYPGGHDFPVVAFGPADIHLTNGQIDCTSSTSVAPGTTTITVGTCADGSGNGGPSGTTSVLSTAAGVTVVLEPGTANQEVIPAGSWSILSGTTLSVTTIGNHTQPYTVRQQGTVIFDGRVFFYNCPSGTLFYPFGIATGGQPVVNWPCNTGATWPYGGNQFVAPLTGGNGANNNLSMRNYSASSIFRWGSFANAQLMSLTDAGLLTLSGTENVTSQLAVGKGTAPNFALDVQGAAIGASFAGMQVGDASADRVRVGYSSTSLSGTKLVPAQIQFGQVAVAGDLEIGARGNVTSNVVLYTSPDAGTTGLVEAARFNSSGNLVMNGAHFLQLGATTVGALPAASAANKGWVIYVSDSTAVTTINQTCAGGGGGAAATLAFSNGAAWICGN